MDGLLDLAVDDRFSIKHLFRPPPKPIEIVEISSRVEDKSSFRTSAVPEDQLLSTLRASKEAQSRRGDENCSFQLVDIHRGDDASIYVSTMKVWDELLALLDIDPGVSYPLGRNSYGFRDLGSRHGKIHTFYVGSLLYMLIWSFDSVELTTRAIVLPRRNHHFGGAKLTFHRLRGLLRRYSEHSLHPYFLCFVASLQITASVDSDLIDQTKEIRDIEEETGHGAWVPVDGDNAGVNLSEEKIIHGSGKSGRHLTNLSNDARHMEIAASLLSVLQRSSPLWQSISDSAYQRFIAADTFFKDTVPLLQGQVENGKQSVTFLKERHRVQTTVLFSLLTHRDARTNLELANTTRKLAEAAQRDSSAMKTISLMTMLFLPGTFFAALFALPSLRWDQSQVIQSNFWVYWAFTLPATFLIFLVWFLFTNKNRIASSQPGTIPGWVHKFAYDL